MADACALIADGERLEVEKNLLNARIKAVTAYFGPLFDDE